MLYLRPHWSPHTHRGSHLSWIQCFLFQLLASTFPITPAPNSPALLQCSHLLTVSTWSCCHSLKDPLWNSLTLHSHGPNWPSAPASSDHSSLGLLFLTPLKCIRSTILCPLLPPPWESTCPLNDSFSVEHSIASPASSCLWTSCQPLKIFAVVVMKYI